LLSEEQHERGNVLAESPKILAIDPGKSTGWASISVENQICKLGLFGVTKDTTLVELIPQIKEADYLVYEAWLTRPKNLQRGAFDWDPMLTPQVIGSFLTLCKALGKSEPAKQQPSIKPVGYAFAGMKYVPGKQGDHWQDAMAHAVFFAVKNLSALPVRKTS
jgi:hypothetical protein